MQIALTKAIETHYGDSFFRSRMEARWAVCFDVLGVKWIHEPEGFNLSDNTKYLPDFYFPDYDFYGEVKPSFEDSMLKENANKHSLFSKGIKKDLVLFIGKPHNRSFGYYRDGYYESGEGIVPYADLAKATYGRFWITEGRPGQQYMDFGCWGHWNSAITEANSYRFKS